MRKNVKTFETEQTRAPRHLLGSKLSKPELKNETGRCLASLLAHLAAAPAFAVVVADIVALVAIIVVVSAALQY